MQTTLEMTMTFITQDLIFGVMLLKGLWSRKGIQAIDKGELTIWCFVKYQIGLSKIKMKHLLHCVAGVMHKVEIRQ